MEKVKVLIIGSGPAGFTSAIYTSRANLSPVLYEGIEPGGQLTTTTEIENFPGYPEGITGTAMMEDLKKQALRFGADVRRGIITDLDLSYTVSTKRIKSLRFGLALNNLFNTEYCSNGYGGSWLEGKTLAERGSWACYFPQATFNILGNITLKF